VPVLLDANGDGTVDMLLSAKQPPKLLLGNGDRSFRPGADLPALPGAPEGTASRAVAGDLDNDGTVDLIVVGSTGRSLPLRGTGGGSFADLSQKVPLRLSMSFMPSDRDQY